MPFIPFTRNFADNSTEAGFEFTFFCDICARALPTDRLEETEYVKYKIALQIIPSLQLIRNLFIGRIIHSSPEQWKNDVMELLKFNVSTQDDTLKWKRQ